MTHERTGKRTLGIILSAVFILALLMGMGPGLYLINPDPSNPNAVTSLWNVPVMYLWAVFWVFIQGAVVITAYLKLWDDGGKL